MRKDADKRIPEEVFHSFGPFEGGTLVNMPDWPGTWTFDVVCRVSDGTDENIWVKAVDRVLD